MRNDVAVILRHADEALQTARLGYLDLTGLNSVRRAVGFRNLIEFTHVFYVVLQSMEAVVDATLFKAWLEEQQKLTEIDVVMRFFAALSVEVFRQEHIPAFISLSQKYSSAEVAKLGRPPVGATGFFIGDKSNGSGWIISLPGAREGRYFMELPDGIGRFEQSLCEMLLLENAALGAYSLEGLCSDYLNKLDDVLDHARRTLQ